MADIESALSVGSITDAVKIVFAEGDLGLDGSLGGSGSDADTITAEGSWTMPSGPAVLSVSESSGVLTITGASNGAGTADIIVGYETAASPGIIAGVLPVTVGGNQSAGFTVIVADIESALSGSGITDAVKIVFAEGDLGNDSALGGSGSDADTITAEGSWTCLLYTSPSPRDATLSRMPSSA